MLAVVGTVPEDDFPLVCGRADFDSSRLRVEGKYIDVNRGTPALLAAACRMLQTLGQEPPLAFLVGDTGLGHGSRRLYAYLAEHLADHTLSSMVFHYLQPDVDGHGRVLMAVQELKTRPKLIADAGFMYAAKMSGQSPEYDLFTPDAGELAFLADEKAPHPFYTRGFILSEDNKVPSLITRAYTHSNAARYLLVKGSMDYVADSSGILSTVSQPCSEAMEAVGGTGDTLTGVVSSLIESGMDVPRAAELAARINRTAGSMSHPTPASQIMDIIPWLPTAYGQIKAP
ncbi:NAD(P)H-hydrate dehydratase [Desulfovermiculus halophilus]|uniref:NAD(P)H-hydrate dehydratase n=1 Tax=Desulfovermiculus halophilus TaxID=339722 RepID=UPI00047F5A0C|nr:NAD(P)H-hydrate dehydratase [Desulfovermiculus halophilus]